MPHRDATIKTHAEQHLDETVDELRARAWHRAELTSRSRAYMSISADDMYRALAEVLEEMADERQEDEDL